MRVIWISLGIFIAIFAIAIGLHDPDADLPFSASVESKPQIENPFAEDESVEDQAHLAALSENQQPENQRSENQQPDNQKFNLNQDENAPVDVAGRTTDSTIVESTQNQVVASSDQTVTANLDAEKAAVPQNAGSQNDAVAAEKNIAVQPDSVPQKKPLGLLARSAEQRRNENKVAVIVHQENDQPITAQEIRAMYMDRVTEWKDGSKVMLYNLPLGDKHREKFSERVLNMSALQADEAESVRRSNNVAINPVHVKAKNIVVSYVERNPNAIAYVPLTMIRDKSNVKVIMMLTDD